MQGLLQELEKFIQTRLVGGDRIAGERLLVRFKSAVSGLLKDLETLEQEKAANDRNHRQGQGYRGVR